MRPHLLPFHLVVALGVGLPLHAQSQPAAAARDSLSPDVRLRLRVRAAPGSPFAPNGPALRLGTFAGWRGDTLLVRVRPHGAPAAVPIAALRTLERSAGRRRSLGGALSGSVVGLALGGVLGATAGALDRGGCTGGPCGAVPFVLGAGAGIVLGGVAGFERGTQRWVPVRIR